MRRTIATSVLFSSLLFTAAAYASPPPDDAAATTRRVSTGVTPPQLLDSLKLTTPDSLTATSVPADTQITVSFVVNEKGQPSNIQVVRGYDLFWNERAVQAVSKLHYRPASIDNQTIPMAVNLVITIAQ
jgi:outer membrane biosynthesis protein TonB